METQPTTAQVTHLPDNVFSNQVDKVKTATGVILVLFDLLNTPFFDQAYAKKRRMSVLHLIQPGQRIGVYVLGRRLTVLHDFTDDPAQVSAVLARFEGAGIA